MWFIWTSRTYSHARFCLGETVSTSKMLSNQTSGFLSYRHVLKWINNTLLLNSGFTTSQTNKLEMILNNLQQCIEGKKNIAVAKLWLSIQKMDLVFVTSALSWRVENTGFVVTLHWGQAERRECAFTRRGSETLRGGGLFVATPASKRGHITWRRIKKMN